MKTPRPDPDRPPILYGAGLLAVLSLAWSGYAITDLMDSGKFGLSVALAGDIGWITVLWAEYKGVRIEGHRWPAVVAGWAIALGVAALLVIHGNEAGGRAQAIAGPFVVLVGKIVWAFALEAMRDPAGPTPDQQAELHAVMRDSAHEASMLHARAKAKIARIRAEASVTLARDETDFEISMERLDKQAELQRRAPLALPPAPPRPSAPDLDEVTEQAIGGVGEHDREHRTSAANTIASNPNAIREQLANNAATSPNVDRDRPSIADLVREQIANTTDNATAVRNVLAARPDANKESVAASVRRERKKAGPYL